MTGIPDPGRESGYFAALERTTPIVQSINYGVPTTTSMRIANGTRNEHRAVLQLIRDNITDFEEFGGVAFEMHPFDTAGGVQQRSVAILNEEHATLLLTYMRNNDVVKDFKKRLVHAFAQLRKLAQVPAVPQTREERFAIALADAQSMLAEKDEQIAELSSAVVDLAAPASAWTELAEAAGDYAVSDAAKVLSRDPNINIRERALFAYMSGLEWVFRRDGRWKAYRTQLDTGRLAEKVGRPYLRDGVMHNGEPTVRVTPKGLAELHSRLGGGAEQLALAVVE
jgi:phage regulator Rha-like protein